MDLESFELVVLRRPEDAPDYDEPTLARIQREHLAYLTALREAGKVATNGPLVDQPDERLRGLVVFRVGSLDEARLLAAEDPAVRAGRLAVEVMHWWLPAGTMARPGRPVTPEG